MTQPELEALFRSTVTSVVNGADHVDMDALTDNAPVSEEDLRYMSGLGIVMAANLISVLATELKCTPAQAWETFIQAGIMNDLPGMSFE